MVILLSITKYKMLQNKPALSCLSWPIRGSLLCCGGVTYKSMHTADWSPTYVEHLNEKCAPRQLQAVCQAEVMPPLNMCGFKQTFLISKVWSLWFSSATDLVPLQSRGSSTNCSVGHSCLLFEAYHPSWRGKGTSRPLSATRSRSIDAAGLPLLQPVRTKLGRNWDIGDLWGPILKFSRPAYWVGMPYTSKVYRIKWQCQRVCKWPFKEF